VDVCSAGTGGPANTLIDLAVLMIGFKAQGKQRLMPTALGPPGRVHEDVIPALAGRVLFPDFRHKIPGREVFRAKTNLNQRLATLAGACGTFGQSPGPVRALATLTAFSAAVGWRRGPGAQPRPRARSNWSCRGWGQKMAP